MSAEDEKREDSSIRPGTKTAPVTSATIPSLPQSEWPDHPLLICVNPKCASYISTHQPSEESSGEAPNLAIRVNEVFDFESRSFQGKAIIRIPDLPNSQNWYFENRRRKMDITVQGQFKRRICASQVATGQAFDGRFRQFPAKIMVSTALGIVRRLSPALRAEIEGDRPHLISTLVQASQVINISRPGDEPVLPDEPPEDMSLLGEKYAGLTSQERKYLMSSPEEVKKVWFEPGLVYTFSFYSHMISPLTYKFFISSWSFGVQYYLPSPFQMMALVEDAHVDVTADLLGPMDDETDDEREQDQGDQTPASRPAAPQSSHILDHADYLWNFVVWHTKLVDELNGIETDAADANSSEIQPAEKNGGGGSASSGWSLWGWGSDGK